MILFRSFFTLDSQYFVGPCFSTSASPHGGMWELADLCSPRTDREPVCLHLGIAPWNLCEAEHGISGRVLGLHPMSGDMDWFSWAFLYLPHYFLSPFPTLGSIIFLFLSPLYQGEKDPLSTTFSSMYSLFPGTQASDV